MHGAPRRASDSSPKHIRWASAARQRRFESDGSVTALSAEEQVKPAPTCPQRAAGWCENPPFSAQLQQSISNVNRHFQSGCLLVLF